MKKLTWLLVTCLAALGIIPAKAVVNVWWDNNGSSPATSGTWDTTTKNWTTSSSLTNSTITYTNGNFPEFAAGTTPIGAITVTVNSAVTCAGMATGLNGATISNITFSGTGSIGITSGTQGFFCGPSSADALNFNVPLTGSGGLQQSSSGAIYMNASNSYSGGTTLTGGQVIYYNNNNAFGTGTITITGAGGGIINNTTLAIVLPNNVMFSTSNLNFNLAGGNPVSGSPGTTFSGNFAIGPSGTTLLYTSSSASQVMAIYGAVSGSANLEVGDLGTLELAAANTYTGATIVTNTATLSIIGSGSLGGGTYSAPITNRSIINYSSSASQTFSGQFISSSGTFNVTSGTVTLSGTGDNSSLGANVSGGKLILSKTSTSSVHALGSATTVSGGTLQLSGTGGDQIYSGVTVSVTSGVMDFNGKNEGMTGLNLAGTGLSGAGALINSSGTASIYSNGIALTGNASIGGTGGLTVQGVVSGSGKTLTKVGANTLTLSGANTYTGGTVISSGTLALGSSGTLGTTTNINIAAGATYDVSAISAYSFSTTNSLTASGTASAATIKGASGGTVSLGAQPINLTYDGTHPALTISQGTLSLSGNTITVNNTGSTLGVGTYTLIHQSSGSVVASGDYPVTVTGSGIAAGTLPAIQVSGGSVNLVVLPGAPAISTNPTAQTACSTGSATFSVSASGTNDTYAWYVHSNAGWGNAWTASGAGTVFLDTSTDNNNGGGNCNSFSGFGDINTSSGNSWGIYGGTNGSETMSRTFPAALTAGQLFQVDMDNGFVDNGVQVGFSLHNSSGNNLFSFYFLGGGSDYVYYDGTTHTTSVGYTDNGLRVSVFVGSGNPAEFTLVLTPCGGTPVSYSGTFASTNTPAQVLFFNHNTDGGANYNLYFNNLFAGGAYDNADNYSGGWSGDEGDAAPIAGATNSTYVTSTGNNGDLNYAIVTDGGGAVASSAAQLTVNPAATASTGGNQTICAGNNTAPLGGVIGGGATAGYWSTSGTGTFSPDINTLDAIYIPSSADTNAGSVTLTLTTTGQTAPCGPATAQVLVTMSGPATASAGGNQTICPGSSTAPLGGTVGGSATGGNWSTSGTGTFSPDTNTLNATYTPSPADIAAGTVTLTLTSTGQACSAATAQVVVSFFGPATASAGGNQTICSGSSTAPLGGTVGGTATGGTWTSSGTGSFSPDANTLNAVYVPSPADNTAGTVNLTLTTTGQPCSAAVAHVVVTINQPATASTGGNQTVCPGSSTAGLGGVVVGSATGGTWSTSGSGTFAPNATTLDATYAPSAADIAAGTVTLTLTTSGQSPCSAATAQVVVTFDGAPAITNQPANQVACSGTTATFSVGASGAGLGYSWAKHNNGGWGSVWTVSGGGAAFLGSATDNDFGDTACTNLSATLDINDASTNALGLWGGFAGDETAVRSFGALAAGQVASIDFDNGNVDNGSKVGFSLQTSGGADVLQFYFLGGQSNYKFNDGTEQDSGIPFQRTGLRVQFVLTSGSTYSLIVSGCGGTPSVFTGSYSGTIAQLKLFNQNTTGGNDKNIYFNRLIIGGYVDTAANYSGGYAGLDMGDQPIATGNGGSSYTTPTLATTDNGSQYEAVVYNCAGTALSSAATLTVNAAALAGTGGNQTICAGSSTAPLGGSVGGSATGGTWTTSGTGTFSPDANTLNATYMPSAADDTNGAVTLTLTTTGQTAPCGAATAQVIVTINAVATAGTGGDQTICAGSSTAPLGGSFGGSATNATWSTSGTGSFSPDTNTLNAVYNPSAADIAAGTVTLTLSTTGQASPCGAATAQVVVTINAAATASAGGNQTICAGSSTAPLAGVVGGGATGGTWTSSGTGSFSPNANALNAVYIPSPADVTAGTATLTLTTTGQLAPCGPATAQVVVTISPAATASAGGNQTICAGSSTAPLAGTAGGSATGGVWSTSGSGTFVPNTNTLNAVYVPSAADITNGTVLLTLSTTGQTAPCGPATAQVLVTINPAATASAGGNQTICAGSSTGPLAGAFGGSATNATWSTSGTGSFSPDTNTLNATYTPSADDIAAGTVTLTLSTTGQLAPCGPATAQVVVTINPLATAGAGGNQTICSGSSTAPLGGVVGGGATGGTWTSSGTGAFTPDANTLNAVYVPSAADITAGGAKLTLTTTGQLSPCGPATAQVVVTINAAAMASAGGNQSICSGSSTAPLGGTVGGGATGGVWTSSGTGAFSPNANALNAVYIPSAADITAGTATLTLTTTGQLAPCGPATAQVVVIISPAATASAGGNQTICAGSSTAPLGGAYGGSATNAIWSTAGTGAFSPGSNVLNAVYIPSAADITNGTVVLTLSTCGQTAPCGPATAQVVVTINPAATASAGGNQTICAGSSTAPLAGAFGGSATNATWSTSGTGSFSPDTNTLNATYMPSADDIAAGTVTLTLSTTGQLAPCGPATAQVVVTINPLATAGTGGNQTICSGSSTAPLGGVVGGGATGGTWTSSGTGAFTPDANTLNAVYVPSAADITVGGATLTLTTTGQLSPCGPATAQVVVTINAAALASTGGDQTVCAGSSTTSLGGAVGGGATGGTWSTSGTGTFAPNANALNAVYNPSAADITAGSVTLTLTTTGQGAPCGPATAQLTVTITPVPAATAGTGPTLTYYSTTNVSLSYSGTTNSPDSYAITYDATAHAAGFADVAWTSLPASPLPLTIPIAAGTNVYNGLLTVSNSTTHCVGAGSAFTITITPAASSAALASSANPAGPGTNVSLTATLTALAPSTAVPDGSVQFVIDGQSLGGPVTLTNGSATSVPTNSLSHGYHTNEVDYAGSANVLGSTNTLVQLINTAPVASPATYSRLRDSNLAIDITNLLANATDPDGDAVTLLSVGANSTNGATVVTNATQVLYAPPAVNGNVTDSFTYTVADTFGATNSSIVTVVVAPDPAAVNITSINTNGNGTVTINFLGVANLPYLIQGTTNLNAPIIWTTLSTNTAGTNGVFNYIDTNAGSYNTRYYRTAVPQN